MPLIHVPDNPNSITAPQYNYIVGMMIDLEIYDNRKSYYKEYVGKEDLDSFTIDEAKKFINILLQWKDNKNYNG